MVLFVGDDWAEDPPDVDVQDDEGQQKGIPSLRPAGQPRSDGGSGLSSAAV